MAACPLSLVKAGCDSFRAYHTIHKDFTQSYLNTNGIFAQSLSFHSCGGQADMTVSEPLAPECVGDPDGRQLACRNDLVAHLTLTMAFMGFDAPRSTQNLKVWAIALTILGLPWLLFTLIVCSIICYLARWPITSLVMIPVAASIIMCVILCFAGRRLGVTCHDIDSGPAVAHDSKP